MSACKFRYGDKVIANGHEGKIVSISKDFYNQKYRCMVEFDDENLIPSRMGFDEEELEFAKKEDKKEAVQQELIPSKPKCNCGIAATYGEIHASNHKNYCDLYKLHMNPKKEEDKYSDLLREFELMLEDDDDDDFGFFGV